MGEPNQVWSERYATSEENMSEEERLFLVIFFVLSIFSLGPLKAVTRFFKGKSTEKIVELRIGIIRFTQEISPQCWSLQDQIPVISTLSSTTDFIRLLTSASRALLRAFPYSGQSKVFPIDNVCNISFGKASSGLPFCQEYQKFGKFCQENWWIFSNIKKLSGIFYDN